MLSFQSLSSRPDRRLTRLNLSLLEPGGGGAQDEETSFVQGQSHGSALVCTRPIGVVGSDASQIMSYTPSFSGIEREEFGTSHKEDPESIEALSTLLSSEPFCFSIFFQDL